MEKRKSKRCPTVSGEISPLRFFKNENALSEFFWGNRTNQSVRGASEKGRSGQTSGENGRAGTADPKEKRRSARGREDRSAACGEDEKNKRKSGRRKRHEGRRRKKKEELGAAEQKSGSGRIICKQFDAK